MQTCLKLLTFFSLRVFRQTSLKTCSLFGLICLPYVCNANNVSLSTQRIYIDQDSATTNFAITNKDTQEQTCSLGIMYFNFDEHGNMSEYLEEQPPLNAAENIARYSPKHFKIMPNVKQTVRFRLRRKSNTPSIEHRSYVTVQCQTKSVDSANIGDGIASIPIKIQLQHNVPLIVRPKKLDVSLRFSDVKFENNRLSFDLHREGLRSVYGKVKLINKTNGEVLDESANFSIYHETTRKSLHMSAPIALPLDKLQLRFVEPDNEGGLNVTWPTTPS